MHSSAFGAAAWMVFRSLVSRARCSSLTVARYSSMVVGAVCTFTFFAIRWNFLSQCDSRGDMIPAAFRSDMLSSLFMKGLSMSDAMKTPQRAGDSLPAWMSAGVVGLAVGIGGTYLAF